LPMDSEAYRYSNCNAKSPDTMMPGLSMQVAGIVRQ
jgi:hypothetical protein